MKALELTKEQKDKLMEMCFKLFPENFIDENDCYIEKDGIINFWNPTKKKNKWISVEIHWFEFVYNHLCLKVCNGKRGFLELSDWQSFRLQQKEHPVDYLYKLYKKL